MSEFFKTKEFMFFKKIEARLRQLRTKDNYKLYSQYLKICRELASREYRNIGWRDVEGKYAWEGLSEDVLDMVMVCMGDEADASFYPGHILYMAEDFSTMALKDEEGNIWNYDKSEMEKIKNVSTKELRRIHMVKTMFEGKVVDGAEERERASHGDKAKTKFFR